MTATETALFQPIGTLKGVGQKRSAAYEKLGIQTPYDLLYHIPRQYLDYSHPIPVTETPLQAVSPICVTIQKKMAPQFLRKGLTVYKAIAADDSGTITIVIYNNNYDFEALHIGQTYCMSGKITGNFLRREISSPHCIPAGSTHLIRPIYPLTSGLTGAMIETNMQQALALFQALPADWMPDDLRTAHQLLPLPDALTQIHFPKDTQQMEQARRRLAFDELLQLQLGMCMMKTQTRQETPYPMHAVDLMPFQQALPFSLTEGQQHAITEIQESLNGSVPMNRLLQGDVGSGKTVVAAAACYIAIQNGLQCALMAPTEILASQHMHTMQAFLAPLGISVALLTGSTPAKEKTAIRRQLADGSLQLLVGTHAIFQKDVQYQKLGLVITDEQHRFGVAQRAALAAKGGVPHKLVMSATPIPRTLALIIYGDLDISILKEAPRGRLPIETYAVTGRLRERAYTFIQKQLEQGRQGYIVCPAIEESDQELQAVTAYAESIRQGAFAAYRVGLLHGKLAPKEKEAVMQAFQNGDIQLLVSTTVIEVGIDVPNSTILLIENAERFGLSQLHQLRGRIGRGSYQSYCILMTDHVTDSCKQRLKIMTETSDGFRIAEADLKLRGPGDFFGQRQHGLPPLKLADMTQDMALLEETQTAAKELLRQDPDLSKPEHHALRLEVLRLFARGGENNMN